MPEVRPLADGRAQRARIDAGGLVREEVGQVEEAGRAFPALRQVLLDPEQLGRLHLERDASADVLEHGVVGCVNAVGLIERPVIHPHDHVLLVAAGRADGYVSIVTVERHQRAGRVEADAADALGGDASFRERSPHSPPAGLPDILRRLLNKIRLRPPDGNLLAGGGQHSAAAVEDPGSGAAGAHVDADVAVVVWIGAHVFFRRVNRWVAKRAVPKAAV